MSKFALEQLSSIQGKIKVFKLRVDGVCLFDEFCREIVIHGNLKKQLLTALSIMDQVSNLKLLPAKKFKDITPKKGTIKEFEIKTADIRVYLIKDDAGHLIIMGGKKNSQSYDIAHFRSVKNRYIKSKTIVT